VRANLSSTVSADGMYLVHYPVVVWFQFALITVALGPIARGAIVYVGAITPTWGMTVALRHDPTITPSLSLTRDRPTVPTSPEPVKIKIATRGSGACALRQSFTDQRSGLREGASKVGRERVRSIAVACNCRNCQLQKDQKIPTDASQFIATGSLQTGVRRCGGAG
jgi:hypothetical protein